MIDDHDDGCDNVDDEEDWLEKYNRQLWSLSCVSRKEQSFIIFFTGSRSLEPNFTQQFAHNQHDLVQLCVLLNILPSICRPEFHNFFLENYEHQ